MKSMILVLAALFVGQMGHATELLDSEQMTKIFLDQDKIEQMVEHNASDSCSVQEEIKRLLKLQYYRAPVENEAEIKANIRYVISQLKSCDAEEIETADGGISGSSIHGTHRVQTIN